MASAFIHAAGAETTGERRSRRVDGLALAAVICLVAVGVGVGVGGATTSGSGTFPQVDPAANLTVSPNPAGVGQVVQLDARGSSGGDAAVETCEFDVDGDGTFEVSRQECLAERRYEAPGEYQVTVRVHTADDATDTATAQLVVVDDRPPIPVITVEPAAPHPGDTVSLSASESSDPDGSIVRMVWRLPDRTFEGPTATVTFSEAGDYPVSLVVTDDDGTENGTERTVAVRPNDPPTTDLTVATSDPRAGESVELDASDSRDADGRVVEFRWDLDDDGTVDRTTQTGRTSIVADEPGTRTASLTIVDDDGASASDSVTFEVSPAVTTVTAATTDSTGQVGTPPDDSGLLWALDFGLAPLIPDWLVLVVVGVAAAGVGTAWRRRESVRTRIDGLRDRLTRGDTRRRAARTASGAVTKTAAKRLLRAVADAIDASGRGVGGALERLGGAIKRWSGRVAAALRRLAS